jgi:hypothetical protein
MGRLLQRLSQQAHPHPYYSFVTFPNLLRAIAPLSDSPRSTMSTDEATTSQVAPAVSTPAADGEPAAPPAAATASDAAATLPLAGDVAPSVAPSGGPSSAGGGMVIDGKEVKVFSSSLGVPAPGECLCFAIAVIPAAHISAFLTRSLIITWHLPPHFQTFFTRSSQRAEKRSRTVC